MITSVPYFNLQLTGGTINSACNFKSVRATKRAAGKQMLTQLTILLNTTCIQGKCKLWMHRNYISFLLLLFMSVKVDNFKDATLFLKKWLNLVNLHRTESESRWDFMLLHA